MGSLVLTASCANIVSSAVQSSVVYIVAKHDETVEKKQKKYTATDKCVIGGYQEAFALGDAIAYGQPLTMQYDRILSRTGEDIPPVEPHKLAYAFYLIAAQIDDKRAQEKLKWMEQFMTAEDVLEVRDIVEDKFLVSHLEKCFAVPSSDKIIKTTRQLILEEQARLEKIDN